jgi:hypothetical protein
VSIWSSIEPDAKPDVLDFIYDRDSYTGDVEDNQNTGSIDVATATSWHPHIRLTVDDPDGNYSWIMLDVRQAQELARRLLEAVQRNTPAATGDTTPTNTP